MLRAEFSTGDDPKHMVAIQLTLLSGLEIYSVDGIEVLRLRSFALNKTRRFMLPGNKAIPVEIRLKTLPTWKAQAYVAGQIVTDNLFPKMEKFDRVLNRAMLIALGLLALVSVALLILTQFFHNT